MDCIRLALHYSESTGFTSHRIHCTIVQRGQQGLHIEGGQPPVSPQRVLDPHKEVIRGVAPGPVGMHLAVTGEDIVFGNKIPQCHMLQVRVSLAIQVPAPADTYDAVQVSAPCHCTQFHF